MNRLDQAIQYAQAGINVFPCDSSNKAPLTRNGHTDATSDLSKIEKWWTDYPTALIGGVCDSFTVVDVDDYCIPSLARITIDSVLADMANAGIMSDSTFKVKTKSGGTHFYFKDDLDSRKINYLPAIDLLGKTGYVILPDQENYVCETYDNPWNHISTLEQLDFDELSNIHDKYKDTTPDITKLIKEHRKANGFSKNNRKNKKSNTKKGSKVKKTEPKPQQQYNDKVEFDITDGIYTRSENTQKADPYASILVDGKLHVDEGMLNSNMINTLFHNREVQIKLATHLGLDLPTDTKGSLMHSPLPGHVDNNPSFGMRWSKDGSHLICRDFSNHFSDRYNQTDFNLVRLYAILKYGTNVPRLSKNEFVTWFLRMMHDSGIMDVDHLKLDFYDIELSGFTPKQKQILNQFQLLDALKRTYEGYENSTAMSRNFGAAWCDVAHATFSAAMKKAMEKGMVIWVNDHQGRGGMRPMKIFRVGTESPADNYNHEISEVEMKITEAVQNTPARSPFKTDAAKETNKREKEMNKKYGDDIHTLIGIKIGTGMHEKIEAFCEDFGVDNITSPDTMILPLLVKDGYVEVDLERDQVDSTWYVPTSEVKFYLEDGDFGNNILIAEFESTALGDLRENYFSNYDNDRVLTVDGEMEIFDLVISYDLDPNEFDQEMLNKMSLGFSAYIPHLAFSKQVSGVMSEIELLQVLNGLDPSEDKELA